MPRQLSPATTLDALKKEAKRWLKALRAHDADARARLIRADPKAPADPGLRDVQHALAREYGYESWRALKHAATQRAETAAARAEVRDDLASYESVATDVVTAYVSGGTSALQRVQQHFGRAVTWEQLRDAVRQRLTDILGTQPDANGIDLDNAKLLVARNGGFRDWQELTAALMGTPSAPPAYTIDPQEGLRLSRSPVRNDWDVVLAAMQERRITAFHARGQMSDAVLERLSKLDHVTRLDLSGSRRLTDEGLRHLARMPQLEHLNLTGCSMTDRGLEVLRHLPELRVFALYHHRGVSDAGLANLAACEHIERVALLGTAAGDGTIGALAGKPQLHFFQAGTEFTERGLVPLHDFPVFKTWRGGELKYGLMDFEAGPNYLLLHPASPFSRTGLAHLAGLDGLFALNLDNPAVKGADLAPLLELPNLGWLGHGCDDETMRQIGMMPRLRMLMCQDTKAADEGFTALSRSSSIEYIWGRRCYNLTGRGFAALSRMPALRGLSVSCKNVDDVALSTLPRFPVLREYMPMDVQDEGFRHVGRCENLEALWCMYCRDTTDVATGHITGLKKLRTYYAGQTKITDRSLEILGRTTTLEQLEFWNCGGITDAGVAALAALPKLREITVDNCAQVTPGAVAVFPPHVHVSYSL